MSEFVKLRKTHKIDRHHQEAAEIEAANDEQKRTAAAIAEREQPLDEKTRQLHMDIDELLIGNNALIQECLGFTALTEEDYQEAA